MGCELNAETKELFKKLNIPETEENKKEFIAYQTKKMKEILDMVKTAIDDML